MGIPTTVLIGLAERLIDRLWDNDRAKKAVGLLESIAGLESSVKNIEKRLSALTDGLADLPGGSEADAYDCTRERELLAQSPRFGHLSIPDGLEPTIEVTRWSAGGKLEYSTATLEGGRKVPSGYGFNAITTDGERTDDHLGGYHYQDKRWNKHFADALKAFMVVLRHDERGVVEYSRLIEVGSENDG